MSLGQTHESRAFPTIVGEPEVVEDAGSAEHSGAWLALTEAVTAIQALQAADGSIPDAAAHARAAALITRVCAAIEALSPAFSHDAAYLNACTHDLRQWRDDGFAVPDFLDSLVAFQPQRHRVNGLRHLVVFPMYTQNGSPDRHLEALLVEVIWPEFVAELEAGAYGNALFVSLRLIDFTSGYDTNSAVLFPETVAVRELPTFTWGAIFQDREAARYRRVVSAAAAITKLELPEQAARMLVEPTLTERAFVMWDLIHDRTHMRGDLPFDPFMIKQRMPYFLYALEELRCDLTAFRECVRLETHLRARRDAGEALSLAEAETLEHTGLVQYAVIFDRIFRFAMTGSRIRNYDGLGGQLLFAWLHQRGVLHWTDTALTIDWPNVADAVIDLADRIDGLYWASIDRPKLVHWLAAYDLIRTTLPPHPASAWNRGLPESVLAGTPRGYTDAVLDDEFPLSMFYEALEKKMRPVIASTVGIRAADA